MPKNRSKNKTRSYQTKQTRAYSTRNTNPSRLRSAVLTNSIINNRFVEDRRRYNPTYTPRTISGKTATITRNTTTKRLNKKNTTPLPYSEKFQNFRKVMICVRRKQRTEVLHALKKTGTAGQRKPRRNQYSNIHCK